MFTIATFYLNNTIIGFQNYCQLKLAGLNRRSTEALDRGTVFVASNSGSKALNAVNSSTDKCSDGARPSQYISILLLSYVAVLGLAKKLSLSESSPAVDLLLFLWLFTSSVTTFSKTYSLPLAKVFSQPLNCQLIMQYIQNLGNLE